MPVGVFYGGWALESARAIAFVPATDLGQARDFHEGVLGLEVLDVSGFACVFGVGGATLRVTLPGELSRLTPPLFRDGGGGAGMRRAGGGFRLPLPSMDNEQARARLLAERAEVADLLRDTERAGQQDRETEDEVAETGDIEDAALSLTEEGQDDSVAETLRERLAALDRALQRLDDGTYGRSVRSGLPIPEERLEADPAAELTVEEARARP